MPKRLKFDFEQEPVSDIFGASGPDSSAVTHWKKFVAARNLHSPYTVKNLATFVDFFLDAKCPSTLTYLSSVHTHLLTRQELAGSVQAEYKLLFRRAKRALLADLDLDPSQANIIPASRTIVLTPKI